VGYNPIDRPGLIQR